MRFWATATAGAYPLGAGPECLIDRVQLSSEDGQIIAQLDRINGYLVAAGLVGSNADQLSKRGPYKHTGYGMAANTAGLVGSSGLATNLTFGSNNEVLIDLGSILECFWASSWPTHHVPLRLTIQWTNDGSVVNWTTPLAGLAIAQPELLFETIASGSAVFMQLEANYMKKGLTVPYYVCEHAVNVLPAIANGATVRTDIPLGSQYRNVRGLLVAFVDTTMASAGAKAIGTLRSEPSMYAGAVNLRIQGKNMYPDDLDSSAQRLRALQDYYGRSALALDPQAYEFNASESLCVDPYDDQFGLRSYLGFDLRAVSTGYPTPYDAPMQTGSDGIILRVQRLGNSGQSWRSNAMDVHAYVHEQRIAQLKGKNIQVNS